MYYYNPLYKFADEAPKQKASAPETPKDAGKAAGEAVKEKVEGGKTPKGKFDGSKVKKGTNFLGASKKRWIRRAKIGGGVLGAGALGLGAGYALGRSRED